MPTRQWSFFVRSSPPLYFLLSLLSCSVAAQPRREWMGIEPTRRRVNDASTALKAAGPTRRPDTPRRAIAPSNHRIVNQRPVECVRPLTSELRSPISDF